MISNAVRAATSKDEPEIIRLLHLMHAEGGLLSLDVDCAKEMFRHAFNRKGGILGVIDSPKKDSIEGMIYLLITRFWYTRDNHLEELFCFVRPDCRRSNHARALLEFSKTCSDEIGIPLVIGVMTNRRMAAKVRLYRRSLGIPAGAFFVHKKGWVNDERNNEDFWKMPFPMRNGHAKRQEAKE